MEISAGGGEHGPNADDRRNAVAGPRKLFTNKMLNS